MPFIRLSAYGSLLIVIIVLIRALWMDFLPKRTFTILWGIAAARLLIPVSLPSKFSFYNLLRYLPMFSTAKNQIYEEASSAVKQNTNVIETLAADITMKLSPFISIWLIGAVVFLLFFFVNHMKARKTYACAIPVTEGFEFQYIHAQPIRRHIRVKRSDLISAPLTYGIIHPVILLPKITIADSEKMTFILTHELTHIRRFDVLKKLILLITLSLHWFNPLVWIMYVLACRDIELACDETVISQMKSTRSAYAHTLIDMEEKRLFSGPLAAGFAKNATKERIVSIMKWKPFSTRNTIMAMVLVFIITGFFATTSANLSASAFESGDVSEAEVLDIKEDLAPYVLAGYDFNVDQEGCITYNGNLVWVLYDEGHYTYSGPGNAKVSLQIIRNEDGLIEQINEISEARVGELTNLYRSSFWGMVYSFWDVLSK